MSFIEEAKVYDLGEFLGQYIGDKLNISETNDGYMCLCPFHQEKTGSFYITDKGDAWLWYCQGECKKGGNIFDFVMKYENCYFEEAANIISEITGIKNIKTKPDPLFLEYTKKIDVHYKRYKEELEDALEDEDIECLEDERLIYLSHRGFLDNKIINHFNLGLAPYDEYEEYLRINDVSGRIVIPLDEMKDGSKNKLGFCYRTIKDYIDPTYWRELTTENKKVAKYTMSPNSISGIWGRDKEVIIKGRVAFKSKYDGIYQKKFYLWNYSRAARSIRKKDEAIIVEGAFDVISLYKAGIENVVSTFTCHLDDEVIKFIASKCSKVIIWYDNDRAGHAGIKSFTEKFTNLGVSVYIYVPLYKCDPDEFCQKNRYTGVEELMRERLVDAFDFITKIYLDESNVVNKLNQLRRDALDNIRKILEPLDYHDMEDRMEYYKRLLNG